MWKHLMLMMLKFKIIFIFIFLFSTNINSFRDPFSFQNDDSGKLNITSQDNSNKIKILAITESGKKKGAILQKKEEQEVVFVGDDVWGYSVKDIGSDGVQLLSIDKKVINLLFES